MSKADLFIELAQPDQNGVSRWVNVTEFTGNYAELSLGNGGSWCRKSSSLAKKYVIVFDKSLTSGNSIDAIMLNGFNDEPTFNQTIRQDIKSVIQQQKCVMLGVSGNSENTIIEVDHKDGRKDDWRVGDTSTQRLEDFQPLCKAANDIKRQICKRCKETNIRWDARNIEGNIYAFYAGDENYDENLGCVGCYQYDPVAYRIKCAEKIAQEELKKLLEEQS